MRGHLAAADFSVRALELLPAGSPDRPEVAAETIMLLWQCGRPAEAEALASTALAGTLGVDPVAEARIRLSLGAFTTRYSPAGAVRQCEAALALPGLPAQLRVPLLVVLTENHGLTGEPDAADAVLAPALPLLRASPDPSVAAALARTQSYVAFHRDRWDRAFALYREEGGAADPGPDRVAAAQRALADGAAGGRVQGRGSGRGRDRGGGRDIRPPLPPRSPVCPTSPTRWC